MKTRIFIFIAIFGLILIGGYLWFQEATRAVNVKEPVVKIFVISPGETTRDIARELKNEGLIRDPIAFFMLVKKLGVEKNIQAGDFRLSTAQNAREILDELQHGTLDVWVTIPEGWRNEQIALKLAQDLNIPEEEFLMYAKEGFMFPDTYLFPKEASGSAIARVMTETFDTKITNPFQDEIAASGMTLEEIVTLASLVEREAQLSEDRPLVASVLYNRLNQGMKLDIDATVQYALGYQSNEKEWWKKNLTYDDLQIDSPYNTYTNPGLPPGPIANPGLAVIEAVLNPAETNYLYYVSDSEGKNHYAETLEGHNENIQKYLR